MRATHRWTTRLVVATLVALTLASVGLAQVDRRGYRRNRVPPRFKPTEHRDNGFTFCRLMYRCTRVCGASRPAVGGAPTTQPPT